MRIWHVVEGEQLVSLDGYTAWVYAASFSPDGSRVVTFRANTVQIWHVATGEQLASLEGHRSEVVTASFSPDARAS